MALSLEDIESTLNILETGKMPDRRRAPRKNAKINYLYLKKNRDGELIVDNLKKNDGSTIINISKQGVAINTDQPFHVGDHFFIQTAGGMTQIVAELKVVNFRRTKVGLLQYGCKFVTLNKKAVVA